MAKYIVPIQANDFIQWLTDAKILPELCTEVTIHAKLDDVTTMTFTTMLDAAKVEGQFAAEGIVVVREGDDPGVAH